MPGGGGRGWSCPRCGRRFLHRNQWHSCGIYSVRDHLARASPAAAGLVRRILRVARSFGPMTTDATKTAIQLRAGGAFAGLFLRKDGILVGFAHSHPLPGKRFARVVTHTPTLHEHFVRVRAPGDIDAELESWLRAAYERERRKA